jgi:pyruvate/2-oxoglutarate dehydrogenase complex dihydrolipoamide dehydrogenase (E3) component
MKYDAIIIGAGQAGPPLAKAFAKQGQRVAVIEGDRLGGTCLNYGCLPTKALRASATTAHTVRRAKEFGIETGEVSVDFQAAMNRMRQIIGKMQDNFSESLRNTDELDVIDGYARLVGTKDDLHQVEVNGETHESERIYLNTGARATIPPIDGIDQITPLTNVEILALNELPEHLIIIGGGYVGLEFGQMFLRFGSQVTIIESEKRILANEDEDMAEAISQMLSEEGMRIITERRATKVSKTDDGRIQVVIQAKDDSTETLTGTHLLIATGRKPNTEKLNLDAVGVKIDDKGYIPVNGKLETNVKGIWAMGDINRRGAFTHTSYQDHEIVLANHEGEEERSVDGRIMAYNIYIDPPLGKVGMSEAEARKSGKKVLIAKQPLQDISRAILESRTTGLLKMLVDAETEQFLGAEIFGMEADEVIQVVSYFMHTGASYKLMKNALPIHPTIAETFPTVLGMLKPIEEVDQEQEKSGDSDEG